MKLRVVESPSKIKKLESILGSGSQVTASVGHIRDLSRNALRIRRPDFKLNCKFIPPQTVQGRTFSRREERVARIRKEVKNADMVYLASDHDREAEATAWHLKESLDLDESEYGSVTFDVIMHDLIHAALGNARKIDYDLVHAQEARRALDRMYGYLVSPLLSDMLGMSLSAGRVQSPAVRLVVDQECRIKAFEKTMQFGAVVAFDGESWEAEWNTKPFTSEENPYVLDDALASRAAACRQFRVVDSDSGAAKESPPSPFSTSLLLQAASVSLKLDPEVKAKLAQKLFEQGVITSICTDSVNFSAEANEEIRQFAGTKGWEVPEKARRCKVEGDAQEAHEAIRPAHIEVGYAGEDDKQRALYRLVWLQSMASQLADAQYKVNSVTLDATDGAVTFEFKAKGRVMVEKGWRVLTAKDAVTDDEIGDDDEAGSGKVPMLDVGSAKKADSGKLLRKQTKPPSRFTKASLIAKVEAEGIGRPSTYPAIMQKIMSKGCLGEVKRFLEPMETAALLVDQLVKAKFGFIELAFTRGMEDEFDVIAAGNSGYLDVVEPAYVQLQADVETVGIKGAMKPQSPALSVKVACGAIHLPVNRLSGVARMLNARPFWPRLTGSWSNGKPIFALYAAPAT
jgi:DNA topoisomerase-1